MPVILKQVKSVKMNKNNFGGETITTDMNPSWKCGFSCLWVFICVYARAHTQARGKQLKLLNCERCRKSSDFKGTGIYILLAI